MREDEPESQHGMVFPQDHSYGSARFQRRGGMDMLEYFTGHAITGLLAGMNGVIAYTEIAKHAVQIGIATINELDEFRKKEIRYVRR